jgi:DNA polymerase-1
VRIAVVPASDGTGLICRLGADGTAAEAARPVPDLAAAIAELESATATAAAASMDGDRADAHRWVWRSARLAYPRLLRAGVRVARCHDIELTEALLAARDGQPAGLAEPAQAAELQPPAGGPPELPFDSDGSNVADPGVEMRELIAAHARQLDRIGADADARRFGLLAAGESAGGLVAAEMTAAGLPWRADVHDRLLTELLGPRPRLASGLALRPARLAALAAQITGALGAVRPVNPDSPAQLLKALAASGIRIPSTRSAVLRTVDHPVIPLLIEYKELARLYTANGWSWLDAWVSGGRFRPEYVVGGVVSGRWASRGGGALQIPRLQRRAVVADPGWTLVVADAAQLEPRILAALAGDRAFAEAARSGDLYEAVATAIGGERAAAKVALLSAMYGGTGGDAGQSLALFRRRFPEASAYVESAARAGEEGRVVRSVLGRTCPPPSAAWLSVTSDPADPEHDRDPGAARAARARGRFTRNFVVQASAADWALVLLALLRGELASLPAGGAYGGLTTEAEAGQRAAGWRQQPHLVFFQHDEVVVHCPAARAADVVAAIEASAAAATRMVFGATEVSFPMTTAVVDCYADAK